MVLSDEAKQIQHDSQTVLRVLKVAGSSTYYRTQDVFAMAAKLSVEASDNAKFLSTLNAALVDGIRMVWTGSRHYNRDERMFTLMERVAYQLTVRCREFVQPQVLFQEDLHRASKVIDQSKALLQSWRDFVHDNKRTY